MSGVLISCSKKDATPTTPDVTPKNFDGLITEFILAPKDITTPDAGTFYISANNTNYKVDFNAVSQSASNAIIKFATDTILFDQSSEFANLGNDVVAYYPVEENLVSIVFNDGNIINGSFDFNTTFTGFFNEALISQWRTTGEPSKPNLKALNDIVHLIQRYTDSDGPGPGNARQPLLVTVSYR